MNLIINRRALPICLMHPWDRRRIGRNLQYRANALMYWSFLFSVPALTIFLSNSPIWLLIVGLVAKVVAVVLYGRAFFYACKARKYDL